MSGLTVFHHAERFLESGGMFGNSAASALGKPNLESWELFTRETLQNSWDARDTTSTQDGVTFAVDYVELDNSGSATFRDFFGDQVSGLGALADLVSNRNHPIPLLLVSDTGTSGLQGSTSAASNHGANKREDFTAFIRNIGRPSSKEMKGGTYGFGKGVLFSMSDVDTVLVYSRTIDENFQPVTRFIAMANSESFELSRNRFSGRHWWGEQATGETGNEYAEPFTGQVADTLASIFQMDRHFSDERPTGTTIAVISPRTNEQTISEVLTAIAESLTRWAWPHMVTRLEELDPIDFSVTDRGVPVNIPDPEKDPLLAPFVKAYRTCLSEPEHNAKTEAETEWVDLGLRRWVDIVSQRPVEVLGRLSTVSTPAESIPKRSVLSEEFTHHVALIRNPRMVVTYWPGPSSEDDRNYAGVFVANRKLDPFFAAAEPTAHDEWNAKSVDLNDPKLRDSETGKARTHNPVNIAFTRLKEFLKPGAQAAVKGADPHHDPNVIAIANELGSIFSNAAGTSTRVTTKKPSKPSAVKRTNGVKTLIQLADLLASPRGTIAVFRAQIKSDEEARENLLFVTVDGAAVIDGKKVREADGGVVLPTPLGWLSESLQSGRHASIDWDAIDGEKYIEIPKDAETWTGEFAFIQPPETAISAEIRVIDERSEE